MFTDDYLLRAVAEEGQVLALVARSTELVREAHRIHGTSPTATAALGRLLTAGVLMGATLREDQSLTLRLVGDGPAGNMIVTVKDMKIKGYIREPHVYIPLKAPGKLDVSGAVGKGMLYVTKDLGWGEPYQGCVPLVSGEIGEDIAYYFAVSEQTPAAVGLGVLLDAGEEVKAAGGYFLLILPGCSEKVISQLEANIKGMGPISGLFSKGVTPEEVVDMLLYGIKLSLIHI